MLMIGSATTLAPIEGLDKQSLQRSFFTWDSSSVYALSLTPFSEKTVFTIKGQGNTIQYVFSNSDQSSHGLILDNESSQTEIVLLSQDWKVKRRICKGWSLYLATWSKNHDEILIVGKRVDSGFGFGLYRVSLEDEQIAEIILLEEPIDQPLPGRSIIITNNTVVLSYRNDTPIIWVDLAKNTSTFIGITGTIFPIDDEYVGVVTKSGLHFYDLKSKRMTPCLEGNIVGVPTYDPKSELIVFASLESLKKDRVAKKGRVLKTYSRATQEVTSFDRIIRNGFALTPSR